MEYTAQLLNPRKVLAPAVALVIGAAGAVGAYALIDDAEVVLPAPQVIVTETPAPPSEGVAAKNEAGVAAAVAGSTNPSSSFGKDEAATAATIAGSTPKASSIGKDEAATAAALSRGRAEGIPSPAATAALEKLAREQRTDPHGQKALMRP